MSYPDQPGGGPYPPARDYGDSQYPPPPGSEYPPPPGEEDDRARVYSQRMPQQMPAIVLPSIASSPYEQQYAPPPPNGYPPDPRYRPEQYHPGPPQPYDPRQPYPGDYARGGPQQHMQQFQNSAPRQRTAIACRYCRRRKIRCSGFEENAEGKCQNCTRFQQDCVFQPVSSQTQTFVPAHAAYPHMRPMGPDGQRMMYPPQLYGAHGQPLGPMPQHGGPMPPQSGPPPPPPQGYAYQGPPPPAPYGAYNPDNRGVDLSRKRVHEEPQPALLPPPIPGQPSYPRSDPGRRPPVDLELRLPPPVTPVVAQATSNYSPGSTTSTTPNLRLKADGLAPISRNSPAPVPSRNSPGDRTDPMKLGNIMDTGTPRRPETEIDRDMLTRLGRK